MMSSNYVGLSKVGEAHAEMGPAEQAEPRFEQIHTGNAEIDQALQDLMMILDAQESPYDVNKYPVRDDGTLSESLSDNIERVLAIQERFLSRLRDIRNVAQQLRAAIL